MRKKLNFIAEKVEDFEKSVDTVGSLMKLPKDLMDEIKLGAKAEGLDDHFIDFHTTSENGGSIR